MKSIEYSLHNIHSYFDYFPFLRYSPPYPVLSFLSFDRSLAQIVIQASHPCHDSILKFNEEPFHT